MCSVRFLHIQRVINSSLLSDGVYFKKKLSFLFIFQPFKSDVFNCTTVGTVDTSVPFHFQFSLSFLRDRRGKMLYFRASE